MITKSEVMELLIKSCPSYSNRWQVYLQSNYGKGDEQLLYADLGDFAYHIIYLYTNGETHEFEQIFDVIEQLHINGNEYVKEAVSIGLLEDIQNVALGLKINLEVFTPYLRPISLKWWKKLIDYWSGEGNLYNA